MATPPGTRWGCFWSLACRSRRWVAGRYGHLARAVWLYAANMVASSLVSLRLQQLDAPQLSAAERADHRDPTLTMIAAALISVAISLVSPNYAMFGYLANLAPLRLMRRRH